MKTVCKYIVLALSYLFVGVSTLNAGWNDFTDTGRPENPYDSDSYSLDIGITTVKDSLNDIETTRTFSQYVQDIVVYILGFVSLIAVIYIIYAGFRILTGAGDEDTMKKSKNIIVYVVLGLVIMWLAWSITIFVLKILNAPATGQAISLLERVSSVI